MEKIIICLFVLCVIEFIGIKYYIAQLNYQKDVNKHQKEMLDKEYYKSVSKESHGAE